MPKVSVIIPTYNSANYLPEAIESVLAQTYKDFEIIVVDDGSTDNTQEVVVPYLDRIIFLEVPNGGPAKARNHAIRESSSEYVAFLDADDIWYPDKLDRQITVFSENQHYSLVHSDASYTRTFTAQEDRSWFSIKKCVKAGWVFSALLKESFIILSSVIVKRDCLERTELFDENVQPWEGYDLWLRIAYEHQIGLVNAPLYFRRIHDSNLFYSDQLYEALGFITIMKKWENQALKLIEGDRKTINQQLKSGYNRLSACYSAQGQSAEARQALENSFARGFSIIGVACRALPMLPPVAIQYIIRARIHLYAMLHGSEGI
jgi:glycosyltransferase involved in cell wall biosynthesis